MLKRTITFIAFLIVCNTITAQNLHNFFIEDTYQRSYFNPALNNDGYISIASGIGIDASTTGPNLNDFLIKKPEGGYIISPSNSIDKMKDRNDIYGMVSVNTFDASIDLFLVRVSVGHAWKANGWFNYSKDLANFLVNGNGSYVGQTLNLGPQIEYFNYNEVYLGIQKNLGTLSLGAKIKRLSGVESIFTNQSKLDLTTSDDIYQLTVDADYEINSSQAFNYVDINNFSLDVENYSFDNFMTNNTGWAFDIGASLSIGKIEMSLSIIDIGSIDWDKDVINYRTNSTVFLDGIDLSDLIINNQEISIADSLETILKFEESNNVFTTKLPTQIFLGGIVDISDKFSIGALFHSIGSEDRRSNAISLNVTTKINGFISAGILYAIKDSNVANFGIFGALKIGPVKGFLSTDNIFGIISTTTSKESNIRAGLSLKI
ncbi:MAG: DUF5723 family protein [Saprospiraceae bacterium]